MSEKPKFPIKELLQAGAEAPKVLVRYIIETQGPEISAEAVRHEASEDFDVEKYVDRLIKSQLILARAEGAGGGALVMAAELPALLPGGQAAAVGAAITVIMADLAALGWIQVRLSLMIAAAYGHDLTNADVRAKEILTLAGLDLAAGKTAGPVAGAAGQRVGKRLLMRYLKGSTLAAVKSMFRLVGIKFGRAALIRGLPLINIPTGMVVADVTTRRSAAKARKYYRTLPTEKRTAS